MDRVESKSIRGLRPELAEVFVGGAALEGLESSSDVVGFEEVVQVRFELLVGVVEVALDHYRLKELKEDSHSRKSFPISAPHKARL
jgi:hypothetical protein